MEIKTILYEPRYCADVEKIEKDCFSLPWSEDAIADFASQPHARLLLAKAGEQIVGYIGAFFILDTAEITNIGVLQGYRGQGAGSALLTAMIEKIQQEGGERIHLEVRESHKDTIRLYEKYGFVQNGTRKGFYIKPTEDAVLMIRMR